MKFSGAIVGVIAIIAGIIIIVFPAILAWTIGIFLIIWGIFSLFGKK